MNHLNLNKPITPRNKYNKNTNKLQNTHSTHRTIHSQSEIKKESRTKHKKEISQNSQITSQIGLPIPSRAPFTEIYENHTRPTHNFTSGFEFNYLKNINQELEKKIHNQAQQIGNLRETLTSIKNTVTTKSAKDIQEENLLIKTHNKLKKKFEDQTAQMQLLKNQILALKSSLDNSNASSLKSSLIVESKISRRAQYAKLYEANILNKDICKPKSCQYCQKHEEQLNNLRMKYGDELRKLQGQITSLKEKEIMLQVLQLQVQNKNDCIDYLRSELQDFQDNSRHLLQVVDSLETRLEQKNKNGKRNPQTSYYSFNQDKY